MRGWIRIVFVVSACALPAASSWAAKSEVVQVITVHGVSVEATNVEYYRGSGTEIANFEITKDQSFEFARGNPLTASSALYLHRTGEISLLFSNASAITPWILPDGQVAQLDCKRRPATFEMPARPRVLRFFENKEYRSGCDIAAPLTFPTANGGKVRAAGGELDLNAAGALEYAGRIDSAELKIGGKSIEALPGTSVALYESGLPRFFTLKTGESFSTQQGTFGPLTWMWNTTQPTSTSLFPSGEVERGIVAEEILVPGLNEKVPAGTGLMFETPSIVRMVFYTEARPFPGKEAKFTYKYLRLEMPLPNYSYVALDAFEFVVPGKGKVLQIPAGSVVMTTLDHQIVSIQIPNPNS